MNTKPEKTKNRLPILDGFRVIAIALVMLGHYNNFHHNSTIKHLADLGWIGVPMFFIISGFVIYLTLERSKSKIEFFKKRYIRLAPGMFICSSITFLFFSYIYSGDGYGNSTNIYNYLIANTFIDPHVFDIFYGKIKFYYIDGAYWSLWVEVCFYFTIGMLYFLSSKNLIRNYAILCLIGIPIYIVISSKLGHSLLANFLSQESLSLLKIIGRALAFFHDCLWFLIGLLFYKLYHDKKRYYLLAYSFAVLLILILWNRDLSVAIAFLLIYSLFLLFIYKPQFLSFLTYKFVGKLGVASYSAYLIHQNIGVVSVKYLLNYFGGGHFLISIFIMSLAFLFSLLSYKYLETPISKFLKKKLLKK